MSVSCKWGLTFILRSALLNFGTRAVNLGHGLRHLHDKNKVDLFQCWFRAGTPEQGRALLKYWATGHFYGGSLGLHIKFLRKVTRTSRSAKDQHNFSRVVQNIEVEEEKMADTRIRGPLFRGAKTTSRGGLGRPDFFGLCAKEIAIYTAKNQADCAKSNGPRARF